MIARIAIDTPLGIMLGLADDVGLRLLDFVDRRGVGAACVRVEKAARTATDIAQATLRSVGAQIDRYFDGVDEAFDVPLAPIGTPFQQLVWASLRTIPRGQTRSYAEQTKLIAAPSAIRAVAQANGRNFIAIVIPCHRVLGASGALTGYGGGIERKQWLLEHEGALLAR